MSDLVYIEIDGKAAVPPDDADQYTVAFAFEEFAFGLYYFFAEVGLRNQYRDATEIVIKVTREKIDV